MALFLVKEWFKNDDDIVLQAMSYPSDDLVTYIDSMRQKMSVTSISIVEAGTAHDAFKLHLSGESDTVWRQETGYMIREYDPDFILFNILKKRYEDGDG